MDLLTELSFALRIVAYQVIYQHISNTAFSGLSWSIVWSTLSAGIKRFLSNEAELLQARESERSALRKAENLEEEAEFYGVQNNQLLQDLEIIESMIEEIQMKIPLDLDDAADRTCDTCQGMKGCGELKIKELAKLFKTAEDVRNKIWGRSTPTASVMSRSSMEHPCHQNGLASSHRGA